MARMSLSVLLHAARLVTAMIFVHLFSQSATALTGSECLSAWNIAALYLAPVKDQVSPEFKKSVNAAFFVLRDGKPVLRSNGDKQMRACESALKRQIVFKNTGDVAIWEMIEAAGDRVKVDIKGSFKTVAAPDADEPVLRRLSYRSREYH